MDGGLLTRSRTAHGSSQFKGVSWSSRSGKWRAQMWFGTKVGARPAPLSAWTATILGFRVQSSGSICSYFLSFCMGLEINLPLLALPTE